MNNSFTKKTDKSDNYFQEIVGECEKKLEESGKSEKLLQECLRKTKLFTPADFVHLVYIEYTDNSYKVRYDNSDKELEVPKDSSSIILESVSRAQPLIANNLESSFIYNDKIDNATDRYIKDIMVVPLLMHDDSKTKVLIWSATDGSNWYQFTQKDLDYMLKYANLIKRIYKIDEHNDPDRDLKERLQSCLDRKQKLLREIEGRELYFSSIIHDIRTAMNAVIGFLDLLKFRESDPQNRKYIESALKSGEIMISLISDALDLSKITNGKMNIEKIEFSPFDELEDSVRVFANSAIKKDVCFSVYFDPNIPEKILSDPLRLKQVINNLLSNALKFVPVRKGEIELNFNYDESIDGLRIAVRDNGPGIAKEMQEKIFRPFEQETSSTARKFGGTGLGLSISMQLVVLLGGKLMLDSEPGKGSEFYFTIPCNTPIMTASSCKRGILGGERIALLMRGKCGKLLSHVSDYLLYLGEDVSLLETEAELKRSEFDTLFISEDYLDVVKETIDILTDKGKKIVILDLDNIEKNGYVREKGLIDLATPVFPQDIATLFSKKERGDKEHRTDRDKREKKITGKTVLVVDDSTINLDFMKEILKVLGLKSILATDGRKAIDIYMDSHREIDIVLMDENMDGMNGTEAIAGIREFERKKTLPPKPIIGLTGDIREDTVKKMNDAGADGVIRKPVRIDELKGVLFKYLANDR